MSVSGGGGEEGPDGAARRGSTRLFGSECSPNAADRKRGEQNRQGRERGQRALRHPLSPSGLPESQHDAINRR